jgi:hypothetical protein
MQERLKGQLPLSVRGLGGQGETLPNPIVKLSFSQHVQPFDADERRLGRPSNDLNPSMERVIRFTLR